LGIVGCAGTGKSILAERLAIELGVPFIPAKNITEDILRRDGYDYASGQQVEKFLATPEHQYEILRRTQEMYDNVDEFVTDRTGIDLAAYAILEMDGALNVKRYLEKCLSLAKSCTFMAFCPWEDRDITDNKKRTLDPWYQFAVHSVELQVNRIFGTSMCIPDCEDVDGRVKALMNAIGDLDSLLEPKPE